MDWRAAVAADWRCLEAAPPSLRCEKEVMLSAVRQEGACLSMASEELQRDQQVVLAALQGGCQVEDVARELWRQEGFVLQALEVKAEVLRLLEPSEQWKVMPQAIRRRGASKRLLHLTTIHITPMITNRILIVEWHLASLSIDP